MSRIYFGKLKFVKSKRLQIKNKIKGYRISQMKNCVNVLQINYYSLLYLGISGYQKLLSFYLYKKGTLRYFQNDALF